MVQALVQPRAEVHMPPCHKRACVCTLHLDRPRRDAHEEGGSNIQRCVMCECGGYSATGTIRQTSVGCGVRMMPRPSTRSRHSVPKRLDVGGTCHHRAQSLSAEKAFMKSSQASHTWSSMHEPIRRAGHAACPCQCSWRGSGGPCTPRASSPYRRVSVSEASDPAYEGYQFLDDKLPHVPCPALAPGALLAL